jgi:hypothetical protein
MYIKSKIIILYFFILIITKHNFIFNFFYSKRVTKRSIYIVFNGEALL